MVDNLRPLEGYVINLLEEEGLETIFYYMKTHVDKKEFVNEVNVEYGEKYSESDVVHGYARNVPTGEKGMHFTMFCTSGGYGAYKVTYIEVL